MLYILLTVEEWAGPAGKVQGLSVILLSLAVVIIKKQFLISLPEP